MGAYIIDTTLRDGEQNAGIALGVVEKVEIAKLLDELGVYQIEAGIPAMGGGEKESIAKIAGLNLHSKVSAWNRMNIGDLEHSVDCGVNTVHISVPSSDIQIRRKLYKDRNWVIDNLKRCIAYLKDREREVTVGLEDASRADFRFLLRIIGTAFLEGANRVRYADTVGILYRQRIIEEITKIREKIKIDLEIHAHNDFGMAVANSLAAYSAGAAFVNCTVGGIGERAGNCDYFQFIKAAEGCLGESAGTDGDRAAYIRGEILRIIRHGV